MGIVVIACTMELINIQRTTCVALYSVGRTLYVPRILYYVYSVHCTLYDIHCTSTVQLERGEYSLRMRSGMCTLQGRSAFDDNSRLRMRPSFSRLEIL